MDVQGLHAHMPFELERNAGNSKREVHAGTHASASRRKQRNSSNKENNNFVANACNTHESREPSRCRPHLDCASCGSVKLRAPSICARCGSAYCDTCQSEHPSIFCCGTCSKEWCVSCETPEEEEAAWGPCTDCTDVFCSEKCRDAQQKHVVCECNFLACGDHVCQLCSGFVEENCFCDTRVTVSPPLCFACMENPIIIVRKLIEQLSSSCNTLSSSRNTLIPVDVNKINAFLLWHDEHVPPLLSRIVARWMAALHTISYRDGDFDKLHELFEAMNLLSPPSMSISSLLSMMEENSDDMCLHTSRKELLGHNPWLMESLEILAGRLKSHTPICDEALFERLKAAKAAERSRLEDRIEEDRLEWIYYKKWVRRYPGELSLANEAKSRYKTRFTSLHDLYKCSICLTEGLLPEEIEISILDRGKCVCSKCFNSHKEECDGIDVDLSLKECTVMVCSDVSKKSCNCNQRSDHLKRVYEKAFGFSRNQVLQTETRLLLLPDLWTAFNDPADLDELYSRLVAVRRQITLDDFDLTTCEQRLRRRFPMVYTNDRLKGLDFYEHMMSLKTLVSLRESAMAETDRVAKLCQRGSLTASVASEIILMEWPAFLTAFTQELTLQRQLLSSRWIRDAEGSTGLSMDYKESQSRLRALKVKELLDDLTANQKLWQKFALRESIASPNSSVREGAATQRSRYVGAILKAINEYPELMESAELSRFKIHECGVCWEDSVPEEGVCCNKGGHFYCKGCFGDFLGRNIGSVDVHETIKCEKECRFPLSTFEEMVPLSLVRVVIKEAALMGKDSDTNIKSGIAALTPKCQNCHVSVVFPAGHECFCLRCDCCGAYMCGFCLGVFDDGASAHTHLLTCHRNWAPGTMYGQGNWARCKKQWQIKQLRDVLRPLQRRLLAQVTQELQPYLKGNNISEADLGDI